MFIWDFGGQEIYHGTHALFMKSRSLFLLVWEPEAEQVREHEIGGIKFRNFPLAYWLEYIYRLAGPDAPDLIVQTQCDTPQCAKAFPPIDPAALERFNFKRTLHYSAKEDLNRASLDEAILQAANTLMPPTIGVGRAKVMHRLQDMQEQDAKLAVEKRQHRTLSHDDFTALCQAEGGISDVGEFLRYLHNTGTVFYQEGLFDDQIILDQGWALEAIYTVFHRGKCYHSIKRHGGKFTRSDLNDWLWHDAGYSEAEQKLFISMMRSCGICFKHRPAVPNTNIEAEYIAPDLLPEQKPDLQLWNHFDPHADTQTMQFIYKLLPAALMRSIIASIGARAGLAAEYWRGGVCLYETNTGSRAVIEQSMENNWAGTITIQTQKGQSGQLLQMLAELVEQQEKRLNLTSVQNPKRTDTRHTRALGIALGPDNAADTTKPKVSFGVEPKKTDTYFISYAWNDDKSEAGKTREETVDKLCEAAKKRGLEIIRDKGTLRNGDSIQKFMHRLSRGDRIFIILSEKYLKSHACMYELHKIWVNTQQDDQNFINRIRVFTLDDAKIWTIKDRLQHAAHWKQEYKAICGTVQTEGIDILGERDFAAFSAMRKFAGNTSDILSVIADAIQPRTFEELVKHGFNDEE